MQQLHPIVAVANWRTRKENLDVFAAPGDSVLVHSLGCSPLPGVDHDGSGSVGVAADEVRRRRAHEHHLKMQAVQTGAGEGGISSCQDPLPPLLLHRPSDRQSLSEIVCLVRSQIEVFVATAEDVAGRGRRRCAGRDVVDSGRVGIRCRWCFNPALNGACDDKGTSGGIGGDRKRMARFAVSYPASVRLVYQSARNFQRFHLLSCPAVPDSVKRKYTEVKSKKSSSRCRPGEGRSKNNSVLYWEASCRSMGMVDTDRGIRLRREGWTLQSTPEQPQPALAPVSISDAESVDGTSSGLRLQQNDSSAGSSTQTPALEDSEQNVTLSSSAVVTIPQEPVPALANSEQNGSLPSSATVNVPHPKPTPAFIDSGDQIDALPSSATFNIPRKPATGLDSDQDGALSSSPTDNIRPKSISPVNDICLRQKKVPIAAEQGSSLPLATPTEHKMHGSPSQVPLGDTYTLPKKVTNGQFCQLLPPAPDNGGKEVDEAGPDTSNTRYFAGEGSSSESGSLCPSLLPLSDEWDDEGSHMAADPTNENTAFDDLKGIAHPGVCSTTARNKAVVLDRVRLASAIVRAMVQVSPLGIDDGGDDGTDVEHEQGDNEGGEDLLRFIGEELYELFLGRDFPRGPQSRGSSGGGDDEDEDEIEEDIPQHRSKREKRSDDIFSAARYGEPAEEDQLPLPVEPGLFPPALRCLVSCLLKCGGGAGRRGTVYKSIDEVEEDLCLMAEEPERFLFRTATDILPRVRAVYGREKEMTALLKAYDRAATASGGGGRTNDVVLVSGYSGTGKTSLVLRARDNLIKRGACFVSGKFDAMRQLSPLSAIVSALDSYYEILARDEDRVEIMREAVLAAIGGEGTTVLAGLMPSLRQIFGGCDSFPQVQVGGREAMWRFALLFRMLLRATCSCARPLVLFLDDMQWADEMSLELMQALVTDADVEGLLFVGAYRDSEVDADHSLSMRLDCIRQARSVNVTSIQIDNLDFDCVNSLLSDVLCATPRTTWSLAEAILHKTGGNALFVVQFLASLRDEGLLSFSLASQWWEWDMDGINERDIADNVVELMTTKLLKLPPAVQHALSIAATFGSQCQDGIFQILDRAQDDIVGIQAALGIAVSEGLVIKTNSAYRFSHDQIQHAAYLLIPESDRETLHLDVGRLLWKLSSAEEMKDYLFVVVDQLHRGSQLITDPKEKVRLAQLSLMAGNRASEMSVFLPASAFLNAGIDLLVEADWDCHRELCLDLYNSCAEIEYILGDVDKVTCNLEIVFSNARTLQEKLRAYNTLAQSTFAQNNANDAINTTLTVLGHLGEPFPDSVSALLVEQELVMTQALFSMQADGAILHLERMQNSEKQEAMKFLCKMILCIYLEKKEYFPLVACRMVRLSLLHGVCKESALGFACYGLLIIGRLGDFSGGYRCGKVAVSILEKFRAQELLTKVYLVVHGGINNWIEPIQSSLPSLKEAIDVGLATGDIHFAMVTSHTYSVTALWSGQPLDPLIEDMTLRSKQMIEYEQHHAHTAFKPCRQAVLNLRGRSANPIKMVGDEMDEENGLSNAEDVGVDALNNVFLCQTYFFRMYLEYLFGEYELAWETAQKNRDVEKHFVARFPLVCGYSFYSGLIALVLARKHGKTNYADTIGKSIEQMEKWASSSRWNCQHKLELLMAEHLYLEGDIVGAAKAYDSAVTNAKKHSFVNEEALASERAGLFYLENGGTSSASVFFKRARDCYTKWGAQAKAAHVQQQYI